MPDYMTKSFPKVQTAARVRLSQSYEPDHSETSVELPTLVVVHGLRHSHATILLRSGVPVHVVARRLGHKDPSVTLDT